MVAPHGGLIEVGTSEIAHIIAGSEYSLFSFEGLKPYGANRDLHITSHQFDHPDCLAMAARSESIILCTSAGFGNSGRRADADGAELAKQLSKPDLPSMLRA